LNTDIARLREAANRAEAIADEADKRAFRAEQRVLALTEKLTANGIP